MSDIPFTFGIITNADNGVNEHVPQVVQSIHELNIPEYQILIVGHAQNLSSRFGYDPKIAIIGFDEKVRPMWITKKKNLITDAASYENIVYLHDYIVFEKDWYEGFKQFGNNWDLCMNKIQNSDGTRFRDWVMFPHHHCYPLTIKYARAAQALWNYSGIENNECLLPYDETRLTKYQYFSGSYWVAKKRVMLDVRLDESLTWSAGEDVCWSMNALDKYNFTMNQYSTVKFLKWKQDAFGMIRPECLQKCIEYVTNKKA